MIMYKTHTQSTAFSVRNSFVVLYVFCKGIWFVSILKQKASLSSCLGAGASNLPLSHSWGEYFFKIKLRKTWWIKKIYRLVKIWCLSKHSLLSILWISIYCFRMSVLNRFWFKLLANYSEFWKKRYQGSKMTYGQEFK